MKQMTNRDASPIPRASVTARARARFSGALVLLCSVFSGGFAQEIPAGFQPERYFQLWKRNPFTLVTPDGPHPRPSVFNKLFLTSWLKVGATDVIFVQNSETNEAQRITAEPNQNNLRIAEFHPNANPRLVEAVISDGKAQGIVKFRFDVQPSPGQTASGEEQIGNRGTAGQASASRIYPGIPRLANGVGSSEGSRFYPKIPRITNAESDTAGNLHPGETPRKHVLPGQTYDWSSPGRN
jgi:hypothetical protein